VGTTGERARIIHPFHPQIGREFEIVERRRYWGGDHLIVLEEDGRPRAIPVAWTSVCEEDAFRRIAGGRAAVRFVDALLLCDLLDGLRQRLGGGDA
jgi:Family of unknown function (DUF5372)